jgi:hypothetical protein
VPGCNQQGILFIHKSCSRSIQGSQATLNYIIDVDNLGNAPLNNVRYFDSFIIPPGLSTGNIIVTPSTLSTVVSPSGQVTISGDLGTINPGGQVIITYEVHISASAPGTYIIENNAIASATGTESTDSCNLVLEVVRLNSAKCCQVSENGDIVYVIHITNMSGSPSTVVDIVDSMVIPSGVVVQFTSFSDCMAVFADTMLPVPLNTNVSGPATIIITCPNTSIPTSTISQKLISLRVVSSSVAGTTVIPNTLQEVNLANPNEQMYLGAGELPTSALVQVTLSFNCTRPC